MMSLLFLLMIKKSFRPNKALNEKVIITKFIQEEPTLDEIFIEKMGEKYEG